MTNGQKQFKMLYINKIWYQYLSIKSIKLRILTYLNNLKIMKKSFLGVVLTLVLN